MVKIKFLLMLLLFLSGCGTTEKKAFPIRSQLTNGEYVFSAEITGRYIVETTLKTNRNNFCAAAQFFDWDALSCLGESHKNDVVKFKWEVRNKTKNFLVDSGFGINKKRCCSGIGSQIGIAAFISMFEAEQGDEYVIFISEMVENDELSEFQPQIVVRLPLAKF